VRRLSLVVVLFAAVLALAAALPGAALAKDWRIERMDVTLDVQKNSDVEVCEEVTFTFIGPYTYVGRVIPTDNVDAIKDVRVLQGARSSPRARARAPSRPSTRALTWSCS